jgi:hypothetical protein
MVAAHWLGVYRSNPVKPGVRVWEFVTILAAQSASMSALGKRVRNLAPEQLAWCEDVGGRSDRQ